MDSTACYFVQLVMCLKFCNVTDMRNNIQLQGVPKITDWSGTYK